MIKRLKNSWCAHCKTERYKFGRGGVYYGALAGLSATQLQVQITPFLWGLEAVVDRYSLGLRIGPLAVRVYFL